MLARIATGTRKPKVLAGALVAFVILLTPAAYHSIAHAQTPPPPGTSAQPSSAPCVTVNDALGGTTYAGNCGAINQNGAVTKTIYGNGSTQTNGQNTATAPGCSAFSNWDLCVSDIVYLIAVALPSYFLEIANFLLSFAVNLALQSGTYALTFLSQGWTVTRDVANMGFLFILIYIAFQIILKAETGGTLATLGMVVAMALVVNFSFFFTRVIIDAGNIAAVEVYNAIPATTIGAQTTGSTQINGSSAAINTGAKDLSAGIMNLLNVQSLLDTQSFQRWEQESGNSSLFSTNRLITLSSIYIGIGVITIILAFAFIIAAVQFIGRIVLLWFAIVASPLAFAAEALPGQKKYFKQWLTLLIRNAFYPVIFLFMFLFVIVLTKALGGSGNLVQSLISNLGQTSANSANMPFLYQYAINVSTIAIELGIVVIMIKYALQFSERFSRETASYAHSASQWVGNQYFNRAAGIAGWTGRQTVGRIGQRLSSSESLKNSAAGSMVARSLLRASNTAATRSFDVRGSQLGRNTLSAVGVRPAAPGGQGGRRADVMATADRRMKFAQGLRTSETERARRTKDETSTTLSAREATAREKQRAAQAEVASLTEEIRTNKDLSAQELKEKIDKRKQAQESANAYGAEADKAGRERAAHVENRKAEQERLGEYADQLDTRRVGNLGLPSEGSVIAAGRIRNGLPAKGRPIPAAPTVKPSTASNLSTSAQTTTVSSTSTMPKQDVASNTPRQASGVPGFTKSPGGVLLPEFQTSSRGSVPLPRSLPTPEELQDVISHPKSGPSSPVPENHPAYAPANASHESTATAETISTNSVPAPTVIAAPSQPPVAPRGAQFDREDFNKQLKGLEQRLGQKISQQINEHHEQLRETMAPRLKTLDEIGWDRIQLSKEGGIKGIIRRGFETAAKDRTEPLPLDRSRAGTPAGRSAPQSNAQNTAAPRSINQPGRVQPTSSNPTTTPEKHDIPLEAAE